MKFRVVGKIVKNNEVMGYKLHSGFSIFYILPLLLKEAEIMGLVENQEVQVESIDYNTIKLLNGGLGEDRLNYALKTTTLQKLVDALAINSNLTTVDIEIAELGRFVKGYRVDASINYIEQLYQNETYLLQKDFESLNSLVDFFCSLLNRHFLNIDNILEYLKEEKGSTVFTCDVYEKGKKSNEVIEVLHN